MGLFNRMHAIHDVIEYDGSQDVLVWRHPTEDFNNRTKVIVGPAQEAIFVKHGKIIGSLPSGTHTLDMENHAFLRAIKGTMTGGVTPYQCTIYYVNKMVSMAIDWGTDEPIRITDPMYNIPVDIRSYGDYSLCVNDGRTLLEKLVGTTDGFTHDELQLYFNNILATKIRTALAGTMIENGLTGIGIDKHLETISNALVAKIKPVFEPYGLDLVHFTVASVSYIGLEEIEKQLAEQAQKNIENWHELQRRRQTTDVDAEDTIKQGRAQAEVNRALGITEKEKAIAEIGKTLAANPGPMGGTAGVPGAFPGMVGGNILQPSASGTAEIARILAGQSPAQSAVNQVEGVMPGMGMGGMLEEVAPAVQQPANGLSIKERIENLNFMNQNGMLTPEEYERKRMEILSEI